VVSSVVEINVPKEAETLIARLSVSCLPKNASRVASKRTEPGYLRDWWRIQQTDSTFRANTASRGVLCPTLNVWPVMLLVPCCF
jgi:hypothetical protein